MRHVNFVIAKKTSARFRLSVMSALLIISLIVGQSLAYTQLRKRQIIELSQQRDEVKARVDQLTAKKEQDSIALKMAAAGNLMPQAKRSWAKIMHDIIEFTPREINLHEIKAVENAKGLTIEGSSSEVASILKWKKDLSSAPWCSNFMIASLENAQDEADEEQKTILLHCELR
jgi:hypothetical protein